MIYEKGEGIFIKIKRELRDQFSEKCKENSTTMSEEVRNYIQEYVQK